MTQVTPIPGARIDGNRDRTDGRVAEPGGCECLQCGCVFIGAEWHTLCLVCASTKIKGLWSEPYDGECG
jgi:hypothetical protein